MTQSSSVFPAGIWTALVTPFSEDGSIDKRAFEALANRQIEAGVHALVVCGTTGEVATLTDEEKCELVRICVKVSAGKVPVIAGAGDNSTQRAVATHRLMKEAGADAALHVTPYYNKPSQEGLYQHFKAIAESSELPIVLYNNPSRTAVDMLPSTTLRLAKEFKNIVAIKETSFDAARVQTMLKDLRAIRPDFLTFSGEDSLVFSYLLMGGHGCICTSSNFLPAPFVSHFEAFSNNQISLAREHFERISAVAPLMFMTTNPLPVKTALSFLGLVNTRFRLPLCSMDEKQTRHLKAELTAGGFL